MVEGCKFHKITLKAPGCVTCPSRHKVQGNSLFSRNSFRAAAETQLYHGQTAAIFGCCDSWKQAQGFLWAPPWPQRAEGCSCVPPALIGPYTTSSSIFSSLIMCGKDRVRLYVSLRASAIINHFWLCNLQLRWIMSRTRFMLMRMPKVKDSTPRFTSLRIPINKHQYHVMWSNYLLEEALMENISRRIMSYMCIYIFTHTHRVGKYEWINTHIWICTCIFAHMDMCVYVHMSK